MNLLRLVNTAPTVTFRTSEESLGENAGPAQPVLVLSNPSSTDISVQVLSTDGTATGEYVIREYKLMAK